MLIVKSPLVMQTISPLNMHTDILGEKIRTNYRLIGTDITSEDLLHMTMQRPDIYLSMVHNRVNNIVSVENQVRAGNQLKLELVNQLMNRIMMFHSRHFTYQDEVFVTSVLQKIGIADVNRFIRQVSRHMDRNRLLTELVSKYFLYGRDIAGVVDTVVHSITDSMTYPVTELAADSMTHPATDSAPDMHFIENKLRSDRYLPNEIFKRIMTAECNNILYSYNNQSGAEMMAAAGIHDVVWMEQADVVQLSQLRENMFHQANSAFWQQYFDYEVTPLEISELTEEKITQRMAAVILENMVQKLSYERQQYCADNKAVWQDYTGIFYQGAADAVERFRYYQSRKMPDVGKIHAYEQSMSELVWDELQLSELLGMTDMDIIMNDSANLTDTERLYAGMTNNIVISVLENLNLQKQLSEKVRIGQQVSGQTVWENGYAAEMQNDISQLRQYQEAYQVLRQRNDVSRFFTDGKMDIQVRTELTDDFGASLCGENCVRMHGSVYGNTGHDMDACKECAVLVKCLYERFLDMERLDLSDEKSQTYKSSDMISQVMKKTDHVNIQDRYYIDEFLTRHAEVLYRRDVPLMENVKLLERINEHNIQMKQLLDQTEVKNDTSVTMTAADDARNESGRVVVDAVQARRNALRVLEDPQAVLNEIYENAPVVKERLPKEIDRILSITDEHTRNFYKQLLGYRVDYYQNTKEYDARDGINDVPDSVNQNRDVVGTSKAYKGGGLPDKKPEKDKNKEINKEINKEYTELFRIQETVYSLLRRIGKKEENISGLANEFVYFTEPDQISDTINRISLNVITDRMKDYGLTVSGDKGTDVSRMHFIHKTDGSMEEEAAKEVLETLRYMEPSINAKTLASSRNKESTQMLQEKLQDMKRDLITQSKEHLEQFMERSLKAQVHTISDKVYLELERRLRNEQRRRGY